MQVRSWKQSTGLIITVLLLVAALFETPRTLHLLRYGERTVRTVYPLADGSQRVLFSSVDLVGLEQGVSNYVSYLDPATGDLLWETPPLSDPQNKPAVITRGDVVYIAFGKQLLARRLADGAVVWESPLASRMGSCDFCLVMTDHLVIVLSEKAIEGFALATGERVWQQPLAKPIRHLAQVGDTLVVITGATLQFLAAPTGEARLKTKLQCDNAPNPGMSAGMDPLPLVDVAHDALFLRLGSCVQRWAMSTTTKLWDVGFAPKSSQQLANYKSFVVRGHSEFIRAGEQLYVSTGDSLRGATQRSIIALNASDGLTRTLVSSTEHFLIPVLADESTLYVRARAVQGIAFDQLWAVDRASAQVRWQYAPAKLADWEALPTPQGLALIQFGVRQETDAIKPLYNTAVRADVEMQLFDPQSGQPHNSTPVVFTLAEVLWLGSVLDTQTQSAWLNFGSLVRVDLQNLSKTYQWP